eukprot:2531715-Alexandrium_andersonii.AAC.1
MPRGPIELCQVAVDEVVRVLVGGLASCLRSLELLRLGLPTLSPSPCSCHAVNEESAVDLSAEL